SAWTPPSGWTPSSASSEAERRLPTRRARSENRAAIDLMAKNGIVAVTKRQSTGPARPSVDLGSPDFEIRRAAWTSATACRPPALLRFSAGPSAGDNSGPPVDYKERRNTHNRCWSNYEVLRGQYPNAANLGSTMREIHGPKCWLTETRCPWFTKREMADRPGCCQGDQADFHRMARMTISGTGVSSWLEQRQFLQLAVRNLQSFRTYFSSARSSQFRNFMSSNLHELRIHRLKRHRLGPAADCRRAYRNAHPVSQFWSISAAAIYQHSSQSTFAVQFLMDDPQSSVRHRAAWRPGRVLNKLGHDIAVGQVAANGSVWQHMVGHSPYSVAFRQ
uniref:Pept_C1 domain-containing protein n=1 Tax=Macrostomum lignano TaxID=282301 RepID=A0A1I8JQV7_9PLAT